MLHSSGSNLSNLSTRQFLRMIVQMHKAVQSIGRHSKTSWMQQVSHLNNSMGEDRYQQTNLIFYRTYVYGRSLVNPKSWSSLGMQMFLLNKWYLNACVKEEAWLLARVRLEHYFNGCDIEHIEFNELHQLLNRDALDKSLLSCWCL